MAVELKILIFEVDGFFYATTDVDIKPENMIKGKGKTPYSALGNWLVDLQDQEYFRPD